MPATDQFDCPWCSHASTDRRTFRTHLMVEHRKSQVVDYVVDDRAPSDGPEDRTEAVPQ